MGGWIKLYRKTLQSDMYKSLNSKQRDVMMTLLLMVNHEEKEWEWNGEIFKAEPGQVVTSISKIKENCASDVSLQSVRTALLKLEKWGFLTNESTKTGRLITIVNWDVYQNTDEQTNKDSNKELTKHQQRTNKELTTNKNDKNEKNDKEEKILSEIEDLRSQFSSNIRGLLKPYWDVIRKTRKTGTISNSVILKTMKKWKKYDDIVIQFALKTHIENYDDGERDENYTLGIMRNTTKEEAYDRLNKVTPFRRREEPVPCGRIIPRGFDYEKAKTAGEDPDWWRR